MLTKMNSLKKSLAKSPRPFPNPSENGGSPGCRIFTLDAIGLHTFVSNLRTSFGVFLVNGFYLWFVLQRLRIAGGNKIEMLKGTVEADETVIGGLEDNKHMRVRLRTGVPPKSVVIGKRERRGRKVAKVLQSHGGKAIRDAVQSSVDLGTRLMTDENSSYTKLGEQGYEVQMVKHIKDEYVRGGVHTNGIESVWA